MIAVKTWLDGPKTSMMSPCKAQGNLQYEGPASSVRLPYPATRQPGFTEDSGFA